MGKLIVFWSPWHGQAKVTASMGAIASTLHHQTKESVVMTHTQFGMADLEGMFNFRMEEEKRRTLYESFGLSSLVLRFKQSWLTDEIVEQALLPVTASTNLYLLPGTTQSAEVVRETDAEAVLHTILARDLKKSNEWVFVDASSGDNSLTKKLVDSADAVVVTLSQNVATWDRYFDEEGWLFEKKNIFYILGGYDQESRFNKRNFIRMYSDYVSDENVGVIPYNVGFMDAISLGSVARFLYANESVHKKDSNYYFVQECKVTAEKLKEFVEKGGAD